MFNLFKKFKHIPEKNKIIFYGKVAFFKNLLFFAFKVIVGLLFKSWFLIAIAIFGLFIGYVKNNCAYGLKKSKDNIKDIHLYIKGGAVLATSSLVYLTYSILQIYIPYNAHYHMSIAVIITVFAVYKILASIYGMAKVSGKTMLIKEYKLTNFAAAINNVVLSQIAIFSFVNFDNSEIYNTILGIVAGSIIFAVGLYLTIDGIIKKRKYYSIIKKYPNILKYINSNNSQKY